MTQLHRILAITLSFVFVLSWSSVWAEDEEFSLAIEEQAVQVSFSEETTDEAVVQGGPSFDMPNSAAEAEEMVESTQAEAVIDQVSETLQGLVEELIEANIDESTEEKEAAISGNTAQLPVVPETAESVFMEMQDTVEVNDHTAPAGPIQADTDSEEAEHPEQEIVSQLEEAVIGVELIELSDEDLVAEVVPTFEDPGANLVDDGSELEELVPLEEIITDEDLELIEDVLSEDILVEEVEEPLESEGSGGLFLLEETEEETDLAVDDFLNDEAASEEMPDAPSPGEDLLRPIVEESFEEAEDLLPTADEALDIEVVEVIETEENIIELQAEEAVIEVVAEMEMQEEERLIAEGVMPERSNKEREPYRLQVGDTLMISMYGEANSSREVTIDPHGTIAYPIAGRVLAVGMTVDELSEKLNDLVAEEYKFAMVNVVPMGFGGQHYTLLGMIKNPGKKTLFGETRLLHAIAQGGGFITGAYRHNAVDLVDLDHAFLARDGQYVPVDFERLIVDGDLSHNVVVESGDYIFFPNSLIRDVYVLGAVFSPSSFGYQSNSTLIGAIARARGMAPTAGSNAVIIRGSLSNPKKVKVNYMDILEGRAPDVALQPGDIVYVPERTLLDLEEIIESAIRAFVGSSAAEAGKQAFEHVVPDSVDEDRSGVDSLILF